MDISPAVTAALSQKKAMYGRYVDTKQWDECAQLMLPDVRGNFYHTDGSHLVVGPTTLSFSTNKAFTNFFKTLFRRAKTQHNFGPGEFKRLGPDEVEAIWAMEDQIIMLGGLGEIRGGGYYHEVWKQKDGDWFLKSLDLYRTYQKMSILSWFGNIVQALLGVLLV